MGPEEVGGGPKAIGDYILSHTLGVGSMGKVKLAQHKVTGREVAIKVIKKEHIEGKPELVRKIRREIGLMRLVDHPHVLRLQEVYDTTRHLYMCLEWARGGDLFDFICANSPLPPQVALRIFREIIYGLEYLHSLSICHRDVKPENVLLDSLGRVKLADFGFARLMAEGLAMTSLGSPQYASPEVIRGVHAYDGRKADVWSAGVILFALLAGRLPFDDPVIRTLLAKVKAGTFIMPDSLPEPVQELISGMLEVDPAKRFSIAQIKEHPAFRAFVPGEYVFPRPFRISILSEPVPLESVTPDFVAVLKEVGYVTDEQIAAELVATEPTHAKRFYLLWERGVDIDAVDWEEECGARWDVPIPMSPHQPGLMGLVDGGGPPHRMRPLADSPWDGRAGGSLARPLSWAASLGRPVVADAVHQFDPVEAPLEVLMCRLQAALTADGLIWLHPDEYHLAVKVRGEPGAAVIGATLLSDEHVGISVEMQGLISWWDALLGTVAAVLMSVT